MKHYNEALDELAGETLPRRFDIERLATKLNPDNGTYWHLVESVQDWVERQWQQHINKLIDTPKVDDRLTSYYTQVEGNVCSTWDEWQELADAEIPF